MILWAFYFTLPFVYFAVKRNLFCFFDGQNSRFMIHEGGMPKLKNDHVGRSAPRGRNRKSKQGTLTKTL